ncbi:sulfotransferase [Shewanella sp. KT0246]|uniref:sulfotransferase n=1 Tax=Shewanella sp. KT0246 TaxID=2815912 RepID=UPI001BBD8CF5|nr:sulfotransferase [Shewanella sp. KT0246]GIU52069.1 hypothetical protein TUM4249_19900 [Shewanella sp. KT0246]
MKRESLLVKLCKLFQRLPLFIFRPFESFLIKKHKSKNLSNAVFLLALPRSGSTVTYQSLCHRLTFQYLSNIWILFYQLPLLGGLLSSLLTLKHKSNFESQHGLVSGVDGPAEGLDFWSYWFDFSLEDKDYTLGKSAHIDKRTSYINSVLLSLTNNSTPFLTAFLGHTLYPTEVCNHFPKAAFIRLRRDPVSNALSLFNSMKNNSSDWISIVPKECLGVNYLSNHEKVAAQVYWLNRRLDDSTYAGNMFQLFYEDLCMNPKEEIDKVHLWLKSKGIITTVKFDFPNNFNYKSVDYSKDRDAIKIKAALDLIEVKHGKLNGFN